MQNSTSNLMVPLQQRPLRQQLQEGLPLLHPTPL